MQASIIVPDAVVVVDGRAISPIDMTGIGGVHAVQWDGVTGHEELTTGENVSLDNINKYQFIIDRWQAAADAIDNQPPLTKQEMTDKRLDDVVQLFNNKCEAPFPWNNNTFVADYLNISGLSQNCIILNADDPIPTTDGKYTSREYESDGITPVRIAFTCSEFITFAAAFAGRRAHNFRVKQSHEIAIKEMNNDSGHTVDDIKNYDITTGGWQ